MGYEIIQKIKSVQQELKAPKSQYNSFGKYHYRCCEDILEAVKPLCDQNNLVLTLSDEMIMLGDRYYVKATATVYDATSVDQLSVSAYAREEFDKKGMDGSQITGAASSYARKYALNGLFCIDDTKDADSDESAPSAPARIEKPKSKPSAKAPETKAPETESKQFEFCEMCKKPIVDIIQGDKEWNRKVIAQMTEKSYGKKLCWNCASIVKTKRNG